MKLVTKIPRRVGSRHLEPGDEFEVDDSTGHVLTHSGHAEPVPEKPSKAKAEKPAEPEPDKAEYSRRDMKAKE